MQLTYSGAEPAEQTEPVSQTRQTGTAACASSSPPPERPEGRYSQRAPSNAVTVVSGLARQLSAAPPRASWPPPSPADALSQADQLFGVAELLLSRGHVSEAVLEAQKAMRMREPSPDQRALYAYMLFRRGGSLSPSVWEHLSRALDEDPHCERALHYRELITNGPR